VGVRSSRAPSPSPPFRQIGRRTFPHGGESALVEFAARARWCVAGRRSEVTARGKRDESREKARAAYLYRL